MDPNIDDDILKQYGGSTLNDLNGILRTFHDSDDEISTMQHSPYYEWEGMRDIMVTSKDNFLL